MPRPLQAIFDFIDRYVAVFVVIGMFGLTVIAWQVYEVVGRQGSDEGKTCTVQNRGLKAQKHLTNIMADIATLLEPPPGVKQAPVPAYAQGPLANLRVELPAYTTLEHKQPAGRSC